MRSRSSVLAAAVAAVVVLVSGLGCSAARRSAGTNLPGYGDSETGVLEEVEVSGKVADELRGMMPEVVVTVDAPVMPLDEVIVTAEGPSLLLDPVIVVAEVSDVLRGLMPEVVVTADAPVILLDEVVVIAERALTAVAFVLEDRPAGSVN